MTRILTWIFILLISNATTSFAVQTPVAVQSYCSLLADAYLAASKYLKDGADAPTVAGAIQKVYSLQDADVTTALNSAKKDYATGADRDKFYNNCLASQSSSTN